MKLKTNISEEKKIINCPNHGKREITLYYIGTRLANSGECDLCTKEKEAEQERTKKRLEEKKELDKQAYLLEKKKKNFRYFYAPPRYKDKDFADFITHGKEEYERSKKICINYTKKFDILSKKGTSLIITGDVGTGKTQIACIIGQNISKLFMKHVMFCSERHMINEIKHSYNLNDKDTSEITKYYTNVDLLILDDVGSNSPTEHEKGILFDIIDTRYLNMRPIIITTNLNASELNDVIGHRLVDRLSENNGQVLVFKGSSNRSSKKLQKQQ